MIYDYYTDGACSTNGTWFGGAAVVIVSDFTFDSYCAGFHEKTTNNRMELEGFIFALKHIVQNRKKDEQVFLNTDSAYITNCLKNKWYISWKAKGWKTSAGAKVKNQDLWEELLRYKDMTNSFGLNVTIQHVKGHSDNEGNNRADKLAVRGRNSDHSFDFTKMEA